MTVFQGISEFHPMPLPAGNRALHHAERKHAKEVVKWPTKPSSFYSFVSQCDVISAAKAHFSSSSTPIPAIALQTGMKKSATLLEHVTQLLQEDDDKEDSTGYNRQGDTSGTDVSTLPCHFNFYQ